MREEYRKRIPKLPGTADKGAPLPEVDWNNRWVYTNTAGPYEDPVIEAVPKPRPSSR